MGIAADLRHVVHNLADALDLVGVDDVGHGKRVAIMTAECARTEGCPEPEVAFLFDLGMLHDIGVSSTEVHRCLVEQFDWEGSQEHCVRGQALLAEFRPLARMAEAVRYHHTRWDRLHEAAVRPEVARQANRVLLADRVDALSAPCHKDGSLLLHAPEVREQIRARAGTYFAPDLVELFLDTSRSEAFWLLLEDRSREEYLHDRLEQGESYAAAPEDLRQIADIFARIVDAKSPFTAQHSEGVAGLSRFLGERVGIGAENCDKLEVAGLLHDLGKLHVRDAILDKPGRLDPRERLEINRHSFETYQILHRIPGFEEIARWAAYHHEEPGGTGYPWHLAEETLPKEARVLRVADIFQAMVQDRPYRRGLDADEVLAFMSDLVAQGRIEEEILSAARDDMPGAMAAAHAPRGH
jgi:HD-GYP domain-containing protein (c-di-GMP phosphodiesterase class II)